MAKKKRELTTRRMPSGAQQYVRGETPVATLQSRVNANRGRDPELERRLIDAIKDEDPSARYGDPNIRGMMQRPARAEDSVNRRKEGGAMKSKKTLAPAASKRPTPRPSTAEERAAAERADRAAKREAGMKAGGKVKKMAYGGKVKKMKDGGFPDLNKDGKVTKADVLQGRGVKKMAMGGKCRGMGKATKGGNYSRG
jgi:hypothetical protein